MSEETKKNAKVKPNQTQAKQVLANKGEWGRMWVTSAMQDPATTKTLTHSLSTFCTALQLFDFDLYLFYLLYFLFFYLFSHFFVGFIGIFEKYTIFHLTRKGMGIDNFYWNGKSCHLAMGRTGDTRHYFCDDVLTVTMTSTARNRYISFFQSMSIPSRVAYQISTTQFKQMTTR